MAEEAFHASLSGLAPHLQEHMGAHVQGDLEAAMAMAQRLEVYRGAGDGAKAGGEKKRSGKFQKETKRGQHLRCKRKKQKELSMSSRTSQRRARARARGAHSNNSRKKSSSEESASTVEAITSSGTTRSGRKCDRNSAPRELAAWPPLPIQTGDQDDDFYFVAEMTLEGDGAGESHQCNKCKEKRKRRQKKRYPQSPEPEV